MKLYKISQNIEYLNSIGVPQASQQEILDYLLSLDKDARKTILSKIRKNPNIDLKQIKEFEIDTKKDYLRNQGYDESIVDIATEINPKYSVWLAREIKRNRDLSIKNWNEYENFCENMEKKYKVTSVGFAENLMTEEEKNMLANLMNRKPSASKNSAGFKKLTPWSSLRAYIVPTHQNIESVIDYIKQNNPDLMSMSYEEVEKLSYEWHEELKRKQEEEDKKYKSHNVAYQLSNGWEIVKLEAGDCSAEGNNMGNCVGGYSDDVAAGKTMIYSLRDPQNKPHVTLEMNFYKKATYSPPYSPPPNHENEGIEVIQIEGKGNNEPIPEYKAMIKEWFNYLQSQGYTFDPWNENAYSDTIKVTELEDQMQKGNDYGIPMTINGIGGDPETYYENLMDAYRSGGDYWTEGRPKRCIDILITYAEKNDELDELIAAVEGFKTTGRRKNNTSYETYKGIGETIMEWWDETENYIEFENPRPDEDDYPDKNNFLIEPDVSSQQPEFEGMPTPNVIYNEEAYNQAIKEYNAAEKAYEDELTEHQEYFDPFIFERYLYEQLEAAKQRKKEAKKRNITKDMYKEKAAKMKTRIYKMAKEKEVLGPETTAQYVEALELYAQEHPNLDKKYADLISNLPSSRKIILDFSIEECKILYETIDYLWRKITGNHIIQEKEIIKAPESLSGNYWLIKNGILLKGVNHFTIIKQNASLFCSLLNLNGMALQEYLANKPHKVIGFILNNGGIRLFIDKNKKLYAQMSSSTYGKWGKSKIKKYDFKLKAVKVIDFKRPYTGWKSGITIKL